MRIKLSKASWKSMGQKMGWLKTSQSTGSDNEQDRMELTETHSEFSYLTNGHEDDSRMTKLRQMAEAIAERYDGAEDVHVALYWLLSDYYNGQHSPEYAALSSSPYSPGRSESGPEDESKMIYNELEEVFTTK